jgi:Mobilization protein NikA
MSGQPGPDTCGEELRPIHPLLCAMTDALDQHSEPVPAKDAPEVIHLPRLPRPKKQPKRRRSRMAFIRLDDAEFTELESRARAAGFTIGAYCRACALGDAGPRARRRVTVERELLAGNTAELNHIGGNLNQMARALNEIALTDGSGGLAQVAELAAPIQTTLDQLRAALAANRRALGYDSEG